MRILLLVITSLLICGLSYGAYMPSIEIGDFKTDANTDVSTDANTYENVTNASGQGFLSVIVVHAGANTDLQKCYIKITIDGGTALEDDLGGAVAGWVVGQNPADISGSGAIAILNCFVPFQTSLLVEGKNDTDTNAIGVRTYYTLK